MAVHTIQINICQYKTQESQIGITHIAFSEECKAGTEMSTGLGGGCDWLKNSSTCNIKFNQHLSIPKKKKKTGVSGRHDSHSSLRRIGLGDRAINRIGGWLQLAEKIAVHAI